MAKNPLEIKVIGLKVEYVNTGVKILFHETWKKFSFKEFCSKCSGWRHIKALQPTDKEAHLKELYEAVTGKSIKNEPDTIKSEPKEVKSK